MRNNYRASGAATNRLDDAVWAAATDIPRPNREGYICCPCLRSETEVVTARDAVREPRFALRELGVGFAAGLGAVVVACVILAGLAG